jgi:hypothetical protein
MNWKFKLTLLFIVSIPAFTGYPLNLSETCIVTGVTLGWVLYLVVVHFLVMLTTGLRVYPNILSVAALVSAPVVFVGATVSYLFFLAGLSDSAGQAASGAHYVALCVTMLTVVPLGLGIVVIVPFREFEESLLNHRAAVSRNEKVALMFLRVFNHIVYFVIPNILETIREEGFYRDLAGKNDGSGAVLTKRERFAKLMGDLIQLGVEGICSSIRYVPLWAIEISRLPDKR